MTERDEHSDVTDDSEPSVEQLEADEADLASALDGLAGLADGGRGLDELLAAIAAFAAHAIPGADGAAVTLLRPAGGSSPIRSWAATADFVRKIDTLQYEDLGEGPCITCMQTQQVVVSGSLGTDQRWPLFGPRVVSMGVHSALSLPLLVAGQVIGGINSFAFDHDVFTEHAMSLGSQFAGPTAVSVYNAQLLADARDTAAQLRRALGSRTIIDQAIGIIRSRTGDTADEAFERLRHISQAENVKLAVIAQRVVDESVRRAVAHRRRS